MNRYPLQVMLVSMGIGAALGFGMALQFVPQGVEPVAAVAAKGAGELGGIRTVSACLPTLLAASGPLEGAQQSLSTPAVQTAPSATLVDDLMNQIKSPTADSAAMAAVAFAKLSDLAQSDPAILNNLISRYGAQTDAATKTALTSILASFPSPEVMDLALRLVQGDAGQRKDAYELLARLPGTDSRAYRAIQHTLETEQDTAVLGQAVTALIPSMVLEPAQTQATLARLSALTLNTDPTVRGGSLRALAQWDKSGDLAEQSVYRALMDHNPELRAEALSAMAGSRLKSERVKTALLNMLGNAAETPDSQFMALRAMEQFSLTGAEYEIYSQANAALNNDYLSTVSDRTQPRPANGPVERASIPSPAPCRK